MKLYCFKKWITAMAVLSCYLCPVAIVQANVTIPATDSGIAYYGRWNHTADAAKTGRGVTYIKAGFTGTSLAVKLDDHGILWKYSIDQGPMQTFKPHGNETVLAASLPAGTHHLLLVRDTEGQEGISEFSGLTLSDGAMSTLPESPKDRRIEVIGDSITAGFWNTGKGDLPEHENGYMAYGPQLARLLNADWSIIAKSGEGVIHNYADTPSFRVHAKDNYVRTFFTEAKPEWDFKQAPPHAILIAYGTNDFVDKNNKPTLNQFASGYTKLVRTIRSKNPTAAIICMEPIPAWVGKDVRNTIADVVTKFQKKGDKQIYFLPINEKKPLLESNDFADGNTHPTIQGDTKIALYLKNKIAAIMGWEDTTVKVIVPERFIKAVSRG